MKKLFLFILLVLIMQTSFAQDTNFKADVLKLISISGADGAMKSVKPQILNAIPANNRDIFSKDFDASLPSMYDKIAKVYMEIYTHEDIKGMILFYESPVGKKMSEKSGELTQKSMLAGQEWAKELQEIMAKYKQETPKQNMYEVIKPKQ